MQWSSGNTLSIARFHLVQASIQCLYSKHFGVNAHVKLATCLYNDIVIYDVFKRISNDIINKVAFKTFSAEKNQKNIISRAVELLHFENWFVESPLNKPCTSLFMIPIMNVYAYFHLNLENASVEF